VTTGTATAGRLDPGGPGAVLLESGHTGEALPKALDQLLVEGRLRRTELVEAPEPLLAHLNDPGSMKVVQVMGCLGLRHFQDGDDVADAQLAVLQEREDTEACPVREGPEHPVDPARGPGFNCNHVREYKAGPRA